MLTIAGNGMGEYSFSNIDIYLEQFDTIVCDTNFKESGSNIIKGSYSFIKEYILTHYEKQSILYIVTGSPYFYSAGILLAKKLPKDQVKIIDNVSSKSYMQHKCMISETEIATISLHGRSSIDHTQFLKERYTFVLCDKQSIARLQKALFYISTEDISVTIGYKLGYCDEVIEEVDIYNMSDAFDLDAPYSLLIAREFDPQSIKSSDSDFETERGMITKQYKRDLSLQNLDLQPNQSLWDIGAGSGSCGIEAYKRYRVKSTFFEKQPKRIEYIKRNLQHHHVCDATVIEGDAQLLFETVQEQPQRIFVGGGGSKVIARLPYLYERLDSSGVMLINAITLKNLTHMITLLNDAKIEYKVISLSLTTYKGKLDLIEPERQLFQIKVTKNEA